MPGANPWPQLATMSHLTPADLLDNIRNRLLAEGPATKPNPLTVTAVWGLLTSWRVVLESHRCRSVTERSGQLPVDRVEDRRKARPAHAGRHCRPRPGPGPAGTLPALALGHAGRLGAQASPGPAGFPALTRAR
jgi:hypothetical protein